MVNLIVDSDIGPDCGDVNAIILLHGLADRGEANILATMCDTSNPWGAPCLDALNTFYGRPWIPVGTLKDSGLLTDYGSYNKELAKHFPHALQSGTNAPDATSLYRKILAAQPDKGVVIVGIGPLRNLSNLLNSGADSFSPLNGRDLVAKKVCLLSDMGGWYPSVPHGWGAEWNFAQDVTSTANVVSNWPTPVLYSGAEIGNGIYTGHRHATDGGEYDPLAMAYTVAVDVGYGGFRMSWDETACLYGVRGLSNYWTSVTGSNSVLPDGGNIWHASAEGNQSYLVQLKSTADMARIIDDLSTSAKPGPLDFDFNICYYSQDGIGTVSARGADAHYPMENAFDRESRTEWLDHTNESWIQYQCADGKKYAVSSYALTSATDNASGDPRSWTLSGSNDNGTNWAALDTKSGQVFSDRRLTKTYSFANSTQYNIYRFQFTSSGSTINLGGIELREHINNAAGIRVTGITLDKSCISLPVADRATLNSTIAPINALNKGIVWTTSNPSVAAVKRIGKNSAVISAVAKGSCTITATTLDGSQTATCPVSVNPTTLPSPWSYLDINRPAVPGGAVYHEGEFDISGGGIDIDTWQYCIADQFGFVVQKESGDATITARVTAQSVTDKWAKAGLMFRDTADKYSRFVMLVVQPDKTLLFKWRDNANPPDCGETSLSRSSLPIYLRIQKVSDVFNAYYSPDGVTWSNGASHTLAMNSTTLVGLCVSSRNEPTTSLATFDNVNLSGGLNGVSAPPDTGKSSGKTSDSTGRSTIGAKLLEDFATAKAMASGTKPRAREF